MWSHSRSTTWLFSRGGAVPDSLKIVVFNAMRGTHFDAILERIRATEALRDPDMMLVSELDIGVTRTGNRHVPSDLARALDMSYAFATEFVELSKGDAGERKLEGRTRQSEALLEAVHGPAVVAGDFNTSGASR